MGGRERKRVERRKRKRRSADRIAERAAAVASSPDGSGADGTSTGERAESFSERMTRRYEERNAEARARLEPLERGERPSAVTFGAVVSVLLALVFTVSTVIAAIGSVDVQGRHPPAAPLALFAAVLWVMAWGMWRARYWAVLGFQMILVLVMLSSGLGLIAVQTVLQAVGSTLLLAGSGVLFYFMIRAMARIQMPEPPGGR